MNKISNKIIALVEQTRLAIAKNTNTAMVFTYYHIGKLLVNEWQRGKKRAEYGSRLLPKVSADLTKVLRNSAVFQKSSNNLRIFKEELTIQFLPISWSHYLFLMRIENEIERQFYEIESFQNQWTLEELERQFNTGLFERLAASKNKSEVRRLAKDDENNTIGIVMCKTKEDTIVEITLPQEKRQIFATQYKTFLPSKKQLIKLLENNT